MTKFTPQRCEPGPPSLPKTPQVAPCEARARGPAAVRAARGAAEAFVRLLLALIAADVPARRSNRCSDRWRAAGPGARRRGRASSRGSTTERGPVSPSAACLRAEARQRDPGHSPRSEDIRSSSSSGHRPPASESVQRDDQLRRRRPNGRKLPADATRSFRSGTGHPTMEWQRVDPDVVATTPGSSYRPGAVIGLGRCARHHVWRSGVKPWPAGVKPTRTTSRVIGLSCVVPRQHAGSPHVRGRS